MPKIFRRKKNMLSTRIGIMQKVGGKENIANTTEDEFYSFEKNNYRKFQAAPKKTHLKLL